MTKELNQGAYEYFLKCLKEMEMDKYCEKIENSLVIDNAIFEMGFKKHPTYTINIEISNEDIEKMIKYMSNLHKSDYDKFDYFVEFYGIIKELKANSNGQKR